MGDPLHQHDDDDEAARRGEALMKQLRALGLTDEEILSDEAVAMSPQEMAAWFDGKRSSPFDR